MKRRNKLILEFTEFNLQRLNPDSVQASMHVDDPQLSTNAFDKHQDGLRAAMSRVNDILNSLSGTDAYRNLNPSISQSTASKGKLLGIEILCLGVMNNNR